MTIRAPVGGRRRGRAALYCLLVVAIAAGFIVLAESEATAHTPHDTVSDVAVSPNWADDGKVFVIAGNRLLESTGGAYGWHPLTRGLPRAPEMGKSLSRIALDPSDPDIMYVSSRVGGVYRSADGGASWNRAARGIRDPDIMPIAASPSSPGVVLAAGSISGFYRTDDGGKSWKQIPGFKRVVAIAFAPDTGRAIVGDASGRVSVSDDDGVSWQAAVRGKGVPITAISANDSVVFAGDLQGALSRSDDGGESFTTVGKGLPKEPINSIALSPDFATDQTLWLSARSGGVYRSDDEGQTWTRKSRGLTTDEQAKKVDVSDFRTLAVSPANGEGSQLFLGTFDGLSRSADGGDHWEPWETLVDFIVGLGVSPDYETDATVAATTYVKGAFLSSDSGEQWHPISGNLDHGISAGNKFSPIKRLHNIVFSPEYASDRTMFSATWTHLLRSTDRGRSWAQIEVSPPPEDTELRQFVIGVSPDYASDHTLYLGTRQGEIYRSLHSGDPGTWELVGNAGARVRSLAFSPTFADDPVMYAGTEAGVVVSVDAGTNWERTGPAGTALLAISPKFATDGTVFAGTDAGLFVTRDKAETWTELTADPLHAAASVEGLAVSPSFAADSMLLVSVTGEGLYRSTDGGRTFSPTGNELIAESRVIADFTNPTDSPIEFSSSFANDQTVFAYANQDILRSTDAGTSWDVLQIPAASTIFTGDTKEDAAAPRGTGTSRRALILVICLAGLALLSVAATGFFGLRWAIHGRSRAT